MWISQQDEDKKRAQDPQSSPSRRAQTIDNCLRQKLDYPKSARLLKRSQFKRMFHQGRRFQGEWVSMDYRWGHSARPRLGITISKKHGKAHDRNRFKRVVREAFRELSAELPPTLELHIAPRKGAPELHKAMILREIKSLLNQVLIPIAKNKVLLERLKASKIGCGNEGCI